jgi:hypothetical protein
VEHVHGHAGLLDFQNPLKRGFPHARSSGYLLSEGGSPRLEACGVGELR